MKRAAATAAGAERRARPCERCAWGSYVGTGYYCMFPYCLLEKEKYGDAPEKRTGGEKRQR